MNLQLTALTKFIFFQVRPLATLTESDNDFDIACFEEISEAKLKYEKLGCSDKSQVFAKMPDWNPAEIIGTRPDQLSYSLYRSIVTDRVWAKQRYENGNIDLRGEPLMQMFCGQPYINVLKSIKSFIPRALDENLATKISEIAIQNYKDNPAFHDKLEFEIIPTCFDYNIKKWTKIYVSSEGGLTQKEFEKWFELLKENTVLQIQNFSLL